MDADRTPPRADGSQDPTAPSAPLDEMARVPRFPELPELLKGATAPSAPLDELDEMARVPRIPNLPELLGLPELLEDPTAQGTADNTAVSAEKALRTLVPILADPRLANLIDPDQEPVQITVPLSQVTPEMTRRVETVLEVLALVKVGIDHAVDQLILITPDAGISRRRAAELAKMTPMRIQRLVARTAQQTED